MQFRIHLMATENTLLNLNVSTERHQTKGAGSQVQNPKRPTLVMRR